MHFDMFAIWVVMGLSTGGLAGFVVRRGGHGLLWDLILGLGGSSAAAGLLWFLSSPDAGMIATAFAAFIGAAATILAQRKLGYAPI